MLRAIQRLWLYNFDRQAFSKYLRRKKLRHRLIWIFQTDAIEGQLDTIVRSNCRNLREEVRLHD